MLVYNDEGMMMDDDTKDVDSAMDGLIAGSCFKPKKSKKQTVTTANSPHHPQIYEINIGLVPLYIQHTVDPLQYRVFSFDKLSPGLIFGRGRDVPLGVITYELIQSKHTAIEYRIHNGYLTSDEVDGDIVCKLYHTQAYPLTFTLQTATNLKSFFKILEQVMMADDNISSITLTPEDRFW